MHCSSFNMYHTPTQTQTHLYNKAKSHLVLKHCHVKFPIAAAKGSGLRVFVGLWKSGKTFFFPGNKGSVFKID